MSVTPRQRAVWISLVLSLALHALLVIALLRAPPLPQVPKNKPVDVEFIERPPSPLVPPARPPLAPPKPAPVVASPKRAPPRAVALAPPPAAVPAPAAPPPPVASSSPPVDVPRAPPPNLAQAAVDRALSREPKPGDIVVPPSLGPADVPRGIHAPDVIADPNERVAMMVTEKMGRDRVQRGLVDPYFGELSKTLAKSWDIEAKEHQASLANYFTNLGQNLKTGAKIWQSLAENYGEGGSPLGPTDEPHGAQTSDEAVREFNRKLREAWKQTKRTLVRITQGPGGLLQHVELIQSSSDPSLDAEIIRQLTQGELVLPVPPTSGQGIHTPLHSVWAFSLVISISPPIPAVMGSFDEVTGKIDVRLPLDRRIFKMVELVSVD